MVLCFGTFLRPLWVFFFFVDLIFGYLLKQQPNAMPRSADSARSSVTRLWGFSTELPLTQWSHHCCGGRCVSSCTSGSVFPRLTRVCHRDGQFHSPPVGTDRAFTIVHRLGFSLSATRLLAAQYVSTCAMFFKSSANSSNRWSSTFVGDREEKLTGMSSAATGHTWWSSGLAWRRKLFLCRNSGTVVVR